ncbi:MAG: hypothetical protein ACK4TF_04375 [Thermodesulfovibrionales bacterium]
MNRPLHQFTNVRISSISAVKLLSLCLPFLGLGLYISMLILWVSPWGLKWISTLWFVSLSLCLLKSSLKTAEKLLWILAGITFMAENILFIWLESIV